VRANADEDKAMISDLSIDQHEIGPNVTVTVIAPVAGQGVVSKSPLQRLVVR